MSPSGMSAAVSLASLQSTPISSKSSFGVSTILPCPLVFHVSCRLLESALQSQPSWSGCRESQNVTNKSSSSGYYYCVCNFNFGGGIIGYRLKIGGGERSAPAFPLTLTTIVKDGNQLKGSRGGSSKQSRMLSEFDHHHHHHPHHHFNFFGPMWPKEST